MTISSSPFQSALSLMFDSFPIINENHKVRGEKWDPDPSHEQPGKQEAHHCISIRDPIRTILVERENKAWKTKKELTINNIDLLILRHPVSLIQSYHDLIHHHVAVRVALFFQQAVVCYDTPFHYEIAATEGQFFEAPTLKLLSEIGNKANIKYQAAHSSTIPGLKACMRSEFEQAAGNPAQVRYFSFLKASHLENLDNSTVGLPDFVNKIDTLIDGQSRNKKELRGLTIDLINQLAQSRLTPTQATRQFLNNFSEKLRTRPNASKAMTAEKLEVVRVYQEQVNQMINLAAVSDDIKGEHPFFDSLLDVNVRQENAEDIPVIRKIVFRRKFEIIREAQFTESKIQTVIDTYFPNLSSESKHSVRLCLTYHSQNDIPLKKALEKLFCVSVIPIEQNPELRTSLIVHYNENSVKYGNALRDIRVIIRHFNRMEQSFQAMLLKGFREELRHLTQRQLSDRLIATIAQKKIAELVKPLPDLARAMELNNFPTSPSTISRLENSRIHIIKIFKTPESQRRKVLSMKYAEVIAEALNIQAGHFFCSFFASIEN